MNKMIIAVAGVLCAVVTNAASVNWNSGVITLPTGTQAGKNDVTAYLWESASSTIYDQVAAGTLDVISEFGKSGYGSLGNYNATKSSTNAGKILNLTGGTDVATPNQVYAVILYQVGTGDSAKYLVNYAKSGDVGTTGVTVDELANYKGGKIGTEIQGEAFTTSSWQSSSSATPEPTSGLLLLLGMAGLALKRKRA